MTRFFVSALLALAIGATNRRALIAAIALGFLVIAPCAYAQDKSIVVASTTSTQDSGLFEYLLPIFKQKTGINVRVLAQGTGQALDTARRGTPMWCSCMPNRRKKNFLQRVRA